MTKAMEQATEKATEFIPLAGRILFSIVFLYNGIKGHFLNYDGMSAYAAAMGVPLPGPLTIVAGVMLVLGGLSVLLGYKVKIGAILLFIFLIVAAFTIHTFWAFDDPQRVEDERAQFLKNIALAGAALAFFYFGSGPKSLERLPLLRKNGAGSRAAVSEAR